MEVNSGELIELILTEYAGGSLFGILWHPPKRCVRIFGITFVRERGCCYFFSVTGKR